MLLLKNMAPQPLWIENNFNGYNSANPIMTDFVAYRDKMLFTLIIKYRSPHVRNVLISAECTLVKYRSRDKELPVNTKLSLSPS